jgi:hypothetical protein
MVVPVGWMYALRLYMREANCLISTALLGITPRKIRR